MVLYDNIGLVTYPSSLIQKLYSFRIEGFLLLHLLLLGFDL